MVLRTEGLDLQERRVLLMRNELHARIAGIASRARMYAYDWTILGRWIPNEHPMGFRRTLRWVWTGRLADLDWADGASWRDMYR